MSDENDNIQATSEQLSAMRSIGAMKGLGLSLNEGFGEPPTPPQPAEPVEVQASEPAPEQPTESGDPTAKQEPPKPAPDLRKALEIVARKDAALQQERAARRDLEERLQQFEQGQELLRRDPLAWLHQQGLTRAMLAERYLEHGEPKQDDEPQGPKSALPPEVQAEIDSLKSWREKQEKELAEYRQQQARSQQVDVLKSHLSKLPEFEFINEMGAYEPIYDAVLAHLNGGRFQDEEDAISVISVLAQQEESRLREQVRGYLSKPKIRAYLEQELRGTQNEARPPRQEPRGTAPGNDARSPLSNDLTTQRTSFRPTPDEVFDRDSAMRRAIEEAGRAVPL